MGESSYHDAFRPCLRVSSDGINYFSEKLYSNDPNRITNKNFQPKVVT